MAQGPIAGCTNYRDQTIDDIKKDIEYWITYSKSTCAFFQTTLADLEGNAYWGKVPYNFKIWCKKIIKTSTTFVADFESVLEDITKDQITKRTVKLMQNIGETATKDFDDFKDAFDADFEWKEYGNPQFEKVEKLYCEGGDWFATLWDVSNAAARMEDYMTEEKEVFKTVQNNINVGNKNKIGDIQAGETNSKTITNNKEPKQKKESKLLWKIIVPLAVAIVATIVATVIIKCVLHL